MTTVADFIKTNRGKRKLTQKQLADIIGCKYQTVSNIEKGRNSIAPDRVKGFAKALKVKQSALIDLVVSDYKKNYVQKAKAK